MNLVTQFLLLAKSVHSPYSHLDEVPTDLDNLVQPNPHPSVSPCVHLFHLGKQGWTRPQLDAPKSRNCCQIEYGSHVCEANPKNGIDCVCNTAPRLRCVVYSCDSHSEQQTWTESIEMKQACSVHPGSSPGQCSPSAGMCAEFEFQRVLPVSPQLEFDSNHQHYHSRFSVGLTMSTPIIDGSCPSGGSNVYILRTAKKGLLGTALGAG